MMQNIQKAQPPVFEEHENNRSDNPRSVPLRKTKEEQKHIFTTQTEASTHGWPLQKLTSAIIPSENN